MGVDAPAAIEQGETATEDSLFRNRDFLTLWGGQSLSVFGSQISQFALPWLVLDFSRSAVSVGALSAISFIPYLIFALPAGEIADRWNRRSIMLVCDAARCVLVFSIPLAYFLGFLTLVQLFVVAALMRLFTIFFDVGYTACLPNLVPKRQLTDANGKIEMTRSAAELSGQPLAGVLVAIFTAAGTMVIDTISYIVSVVSLFAIKRPFSALATRQEDGTFWERIGEGLRYVWNNPLIRALSAATAFGNLATSTASGVFVYRARIELGFNATATGIFLASLAIGQFFASLIVGRLAKKVPTGRQILVAAMVQPFFIAAFAFTGNLTAMTIVGICWGVAVTLLNVPFITLRQATIPDHLLGRASAAIRMVAWSSIPIGGFLGGLIASRYSTHATFIVAAAILSLAVIYIILSPIPHAETPRT